MASTAIKILGATIQFGTTAGTVFTNNTLSATGDSSDRLNINLNPSTTNTVDYPLVLVRTTSGTPAIGIGTGLQFVTETSNNNNEIGATIEAITTDATPGSEDFKVVVKTMVNGAAATERLSIDSNGLIINGNTLRHSNSATFTPTAGNWYRIATSVLGIARNWGVFTIQWTVSGQHGSVSFAAGCHYGQAAGTKIQEISNTYFGTSGVVAARVVYHTTYTGNYAYLEYQISSNTASTSVRVEGQDLLGWSLLDPSTAGSIPAGYTSTQHTFGQLTEYSYIAIPGDTAGSTRELEIGTGRTGSAGISRIDLISDITSYTDYGLRIVRDATSAPNGLSQIVHRGTGNFEIIAQEAATLNLKTNNTNQVTINSIGEVTITGVTGSSSTARTSVAISNAATNPSLSGTTLKKGINISSTGTWVGSGGLHYGNNYGIYVTATDGDNNYSFWGEQGDLYNRGRITAGGGVSIQNDLIIYNTTESQNNTTIQNPRTTAPGIARTIYLPTPGTNGQYFAVTSNADGSGAVATDATNAANIAITDDVSTNANYFPVWVTANSGNQGARVSSTKLYYNPNTGTLNSTLFNSLSARAKKKDIYVYEGKALDIIEKTQIVKFKFKDDTTETEHIGFIADDTPEELAGKDKQQMLIADSIGVLLKAVQELSARVKVLEEINNSLESLGD